MTAMILAMQQYNNSTMFFIFNFELLILYNKEVERWWPIIFSLLVILLFIGIGLLLVLPNRFKIENENNFVKEVIIRQPAVAGQFYPQREKDLRVMADKFLSVAKQEIEKENDPFPILIVPHAGWEYSGQTAAFGFAQIEDNDFKKVVLIGPSHQAFFEGAAIDDSDFWQTPLGKVAVDKALINKILAPEEKIIVNRGVHDNEHCLEVELPFLQMVLSDFKIVPILIGQASESTLELLAKVLAANFDEKTLLVVSSDLSHYPDSKTAKVVDQQTVEAILSGSKDRLVEVLKKLTDEYPQVDTFACGSEAIKVGLAVAESLSMGKGRLFSKTNSGTVSGQEDRVVGYAAMGFLGKLNPPALHHNGTGPAGGQSSKFKAEEELDGDQQKTLLEIARQALENYFKTEKVSDIKVNDELLKQERGVFVTLKKDGQLRGCIGQFVPQKPLYQLVQDMAVSAAAYDHRFSPLQYHELGNIKIEISVLSPMEKISFWQNVELGKYGVYLKYGDRSATFLPQVAAETGWSREEFLSQLCAQKMGLSENCYQDPQAELFVYTAQVFGEE